MIPLFITVFLFSSATIRANSNADAFFEAGLYDKAIPLYEELLQDPLGEQKQTREKLAFSYYGVEDYSSTIHHLAYSYDRSILASYYLAMAYRKLEQYNEAISLIENLLSNTTSFKDQLQYELGLNHFFLKNFERARITFNELYTSSNIHFKILSSFYLSRIYSHFAQYDKASEMLEKITPLVSKDDSLRYELAYLKGEIAFYKQDFLQAALYFEDALPPDSLYEMPWFYDASYYQAISYLKAGDNSDTNRDVQERCLKKAESVLLNLFAKFPGEQVVLALSRCYIAKSQRLKDAEAFREANNLLARHDLIKSREGLAQALFLRAEAAQTYTERNRFYRNLTQEAHRDTQVYAKGWYLRGLNEFEEGQSLLINEETEEATRLFHEAFQSLNFAFQLLKDSDPSFAGLALQYQALSALCQGEDDKFEKAKHCLENLILQPEILNKMANANQIYYLYNTIIASSSEMKDQVEPAIRLSLNQFNQASYRNKSLFLLAVFYYNHKEYLKAQKIFLKLNSSVDGISMSSSHPNALFWAARCADQLNNPTEAKLYRQQFIEHSPDSSLAPEALFSLYSYQDYLQGDRLAVKQLDSFLKKHPKSPFAIHGWYLLGLDLKRDRKTPEGKWIRKKNLIAAIDAFQKAESLFEELSTKGLIADQDFSILIPLRYQASLERVQAILAVADTAQGAKRQIHLEYAEEGLQNLVKDLDQLVARTENIKFFNQMGEEAYYWLAQAYIKGNKDQMALDVLNKTLERYQLKKITRGYFLSQAWYEKAMIEKRSENYAEALKSIMLAEDASKGKVLNSDQKLNLWIEQSLIYQALNDFDQAILTLSKAINDDAISGLRIKAMFLRAEAYEHQGRKELARRQLESASKKGGEWGKKAKEKLGTIQ